MVFVGFFIERRIAVSKMGSINLFASFAPYARCAEIDQTTKCLVQDKATNYEKSVLAVAMAWAKGETGEAVDLHFQVRPALSYYVHFGSKYRYQ